MNEDIKKNYFISRRTCDTHCLEGGQSGGDIYVNGGDATSGGPAMFDRNDVSTLAAAIGYTNPAANAAFNLSGHCLVKCRQLLTLRLYHAISGDNLPISATECFVDAYLCRPRSENTSEDNVGGNRIDYPWTAFKYGFGAQESDPTPYVQHTDIGCSPYMNNVFCERFKIIKKKSFALTIQKPYRILGVKKVVNFDYRSWAAHGAISGLARQGTCYWLINIRGTPGRDPTNEGVDTLEARVLIDCRNVYSFTPLAANASSNTSSSRITYKEYGLSTGEIVNASVSAVSGPAND